MNQHIISRLWLILALLPILISCEEPFEFDPDDLEARLVVEASISDGPEPDWVILRESGALAPAEPYAMVSDATVSITRQGTSYPATLISEGVYTFPGLTPEAGQSYHLQITQGAERWEATSYMPLPLVPDSFSFSYSGATPVREEGYLMRAHIATVPQGVYLRFKVFKDGVLLPDIFLYDSSSSRNEPGGYSFRTEAFEAGDSLRIQTVAMDQASYLYYSQLADLSGSGFGPGAAAPANPESNLSGQAIGLFAAVSITEQTVVVE
jgi:hypothetical protein